MDVPGFEERGIHRKYEASTPAFAGMTIRFEMELRHPPDFAGMAGKNVGKTQALILVLFIANRLITL
ncbi:hypothetical protein [Dyella nitratireducens]|nr:hypothetical protein [Dyella nitratireducens]